MTSKSLKVKNRATVKQDFKYCSIHINKPSTIVTAEIYQARMLSHAVVIPESLKYNSIVAAMPCYEDLYFFTAGLNSSLLAVRRRSRRELHTTS